jgi:hypothetical protein
MLGWPHSGFGAYIGPRIEDRAGLLRVARYCPRAPVAESRVRYDAARAEVELVADRADGPYAGVHRMTALEFLARWVDHVPERYEVRVRCAGAYATRRRMSWRRRGIVLAGASGEPSRAVEPEQSWPALRARRRRWAELLRLVFKVEVASAARMRATISSGYSTTSERGSTTPSSNSFMGGGAAAGRGKRARPEGRVVARLVIFAMERAPVGVESAPRGSKFISLLPTHREWSRLGT